MSTKIKKQGSSQVDLKRRKQLASIGKTAAALAAMSLIPGLTYGAQLAFKPKSQSSEALYMDNNGNVVIGGRTNTNSRKLCVNGTIEGDKVYNAVWNDLAEFRPLKKGEKKVPGKAYVMTEHGLVLSSKRAQLGTAGICSDTYGFALGGNENDKTKIAIAISGWALAYVDKKYPIGTALVATKNGILTKARMCDLLFRSTRILGIVETQPGAYGKLAVNGRYWVKVV